MTEEMKQAMDKLTMLRAALAVVENQAIAAGNWQQAAILRCSEIVARKAAQAAIKAPSSTTALIISSGIDEIIADLSR